MTMTNNAIAKELSELRAQVEELMQVRKPEQTNTPDQSDELSEEAITTESEVDSIKTESDTTEEKSATEAQILEFINTLEEEFKDISPMSMLVVFSLGVLIGRLLPR